MARAWCWIAREWTAAAPKVPAATSPAPPPPVLGSPPSASAPSTAGSRKKEAADRVRTTLAVFRQQGESGTRLVLPLDGRVHGRPQVGQRDLLGRYRVSAGRRSHGCPIFLRRSRDPEAGQRNLRPRGLPVDAGWRSLCCSRTAGVPGKAFSRTSGTLIANWACCTFWPSARPPIPFRRNPGTPGSAPSTNTESTSSSAAARCSRTSIRRPGSISGTGATAASWISS